LTFIESNFEEMTPDEQLDVIHLDIRKYSTKLKIPKLVELNKINDLQALNILRFVLENSDPIFVDWLEDNIDYFNDIIRNEVADQNKQGMKWDDVILRCEWKWKIQQALVTHKQSDEVVKSVMKLTIQYLFMFDAMVLNQMTE